MQTVDPDTDLEALMRRWHHTTEFAAAAWTEYTTLRESEFVSGHRLAAAFGRWGSAERERLALMRAIEQLEEAEAA